MPFIQWDSRLETGWPKIDQQHRILVEAFNDLVTAVHHPGAPGDIEQRLTYLVEYTERHFRMEEALMLAHGHGDFALHKGFHDELLRMIRELHHRFLMHRLELSPSVLHFLEGWLLEHFQGEDQRLAAFLQAVDSDAVAGLGPDTTWGSTRGDGEPVKLARGPLSFMSDAVAGLGPDTTWGSTRGFDACVE